MTNARFILLSSLLASFAVLTGCNSLAGNSCMKPLSAADAQDHAPLKIPLGLDAPDTREALKIPELTEPEQPPPPQGRCLEDPPQLLVPTTSAAPAAESKKAKKERKAPAPKQPGSK